MNTEAYFIEIKITVDDMGEFFTDSENAREKMEAAAINQAHGYYSYTVKKVLVVDNRPEVKK